MPDVTINLDPNCALVLFELLTRWDEKDSPLPFDDSSEQTALLKLLGSLEKTLLEPFRPDYNALLEKARSELRAESGL